MEDYLKIVNEIKEAYANSQQALFSVGSGL